MLSLVFGANPRSLKKGKKMSKKRKGARRSASKKRKTNPAKGSHKKSGKGRRRRHNPSGSVKKLGSKAWDIAYKGAGLALGAVGFDVLAQNLLPTSIRTSSYASAVKAGAAVVTGIALSFVPVNAVKKLAAPIAIGGVAKAGYDLVAPEVLPKLAFNVLGEANYLGELDTRSLTLGGLGQYDQRVLQRTLGEQPVNRLPFGLPG